MPQATPALQQPIPITASPAGAANPQANQANANNANVPATVNQNRPKVSRFSASMRNVLENGPGKVWQSAANLSNGASRALSPVTTRLTNLSQTIEFKFGTNARRLFNLIVKIAPITFFLLCTPSFVITVGYMLIRLLKLYDPTIYNPYAKVMRTVTKYLGIYAGVKTVIHAAGVAFAATSHTHLLVSAIYLIATSDLIKFYNEMTIIVKPPQIAIAAVQAPGVQPGAISSVTAQPAVVTESPLQPAPSPETRRTALIGNHTPAPRLRAAQGRTPPTIEEEIRENSDSDADSDVDESPQRKVATQDREAESATPGSGDAEVLNRPTKRKKRKERESIGLSTPEQAMTPPAPISKDEVVTPNVNEKRGGSVSTPDSDNEASEIR